ncbi:A-type flagellin [compost metagenome]
MKGSDDISFSVTEADATHTYDVGINGVAPAAVNSAAGRIAVGEVKLDGVKSFSFSNASAEIFAAASGASTVDSVAKIDVSTVDNAQKAIDVIDAALKSIDTQRADLGAVQNRFDNTINNLQNISENASAARSRIKDTDYAAETANLAKNQVLQQAGTAILAQAKQLPQAVLSLLQ